MTNKLTYGVARAYGKNTRGEWTPGGTHAVATARIDRPHRTGGGSYVREEGDALCQPAAKFARLEIEPPSSQVTCKKCLEHIGKLGLDAGEPETTEPAQSTVVAAREAYQEIEKIRAPAPRKRASAKERVKASVRVSMPRLVEAVETVAQVIDLGAAKNNPALRCVWLEWQHDELAVHATDMETCWSIAVEAKTTGTGGAAVEAKALVSLLRAMDLGEVEAEIELLDNAWLQIREKRGSISSEAKLVGLPLGDMPDLPDVDGVAKWTKVDAAELATTLRRALPAASKMPDKPHLHVVVFSTKGAAKGSANALTTDGHRAIRVKAPRLGLDTVDLPWRSAKRLRKLAESVGAGDTLEVGKADRWLFVRSLDDDRSSAIGIKVAHANFPPLDSLIDKEVIPKVSGGAKVLVTDLEAALASAAAIDDAVIIELGTSTVVFKAKNPKFGDGEFEIAAEVRAGPCRRVMVTTSLLRELVAAAKDGTSHLDVDLTDVWGPLLIRPSEQPGFVAILMPRRMDRSEGASDA